MLQCPKPKKQCKRNKKHVPQVPIYISDYDDFSDLEMLDDVPSGCEGRTVLSVDLKYAEIALKSYEERQEAKFVILRVLFSNRAILDVPGYDADKLWCHVSFIAEPRNAGCIHDPPKHFFGEMVFDRAQDKYDVTYCSIFDPTDPSNVGGCVFCPQMEAFLHPVDGCPANGRQSDKIMAQKGVDVSQGQTDGCSKRHPEAPNVFRNSRDSKIIVKAVEAVRLEYAKIALEFYQKSKDAEFGIDEVMYSASEPVIRGSNMKEEWWCHVVFTAKPQNVDCSEYFFGELLRDPTTGKYDATYCEIFKPPSDYMPYHRCIICSPYEKHPTSGFHVGRPPHVISE
ncbi:hypothetical protein M5689_013962 [Euphorbia peplus]|nr:hypothetical protein M5689_013962 [Euphorbia peplus]